MQIDFHHGATYVVARLAGFPPDEAEVIAHSAQYVDDATEQGEIWFNNGMLYPRLSSAHKMLDYRNSKKLANHRVWLPFHFLPGNNGEAAPDAPPQLSRDELIQRCICRPNSYPARELMYAVITRQDRPYALHRLGIAAHVFIDTWAHQGFVGYQHAVNVGKDIEAEDTHHEKSFQERFGEFWKKDWETTLSDFLGEALPLGHGTVLSYPDRPYLRWSYMNGLGQRVNRDNPNDFREAAHQLYFHFRRYRDFKEAGEGVMGMQYELPPAFSVFDEKIEAIRDEEGENRHEAWLELIRNGAFGFSEDIEYVAKGQGSWKNQALGTLEDIGHTEGAPVPYPAGFLTSNWKQFHDALQAHRFFVLNELLPRYGILAG